ncbi:MAG: saccharopine dehydrogenase [Pseudomonadota bacterium]
MTPTHIWVRAEQKTDETRTGITPESALALIADGYRITVEASETRVINTKAYKVSGCDIAPAYSWPSAPDDAIIFGLKELPDDGTPLSHRHIMFGHAFKGQRTGQRLLARFQAGGGQLWDLEYLTDRTGRRVAAFGYWAGFIGAAVAALCWAAEQTGRLMSPLSPYEDAQSLIAEVREELKILDGPHPKTLIIGALGRVGRGASEFCQAVQIPVTLWDSEETKHGGPFPEILSHEIFLNCILAGPDTPVFLQADDTAKPRRLGVVGDIACDPDSSFNPVKLYNEATQWDMPAHRVVETPPLDVTAIDNLPSLLPLESSLDFAQQLLPILRDLKDDPDQVWHRAKKVFEAQTKN